MTVSLTLENVDKTKLNDSSLKGAFVVFLTGEKEWLGPYSISLPTLDKDNKLQLEFKVPANAKAVIDYIPAIHGQDYAAQSPIMRVLLKTDGAFIGYKDFCNVMLQKVVLTVVEGITSLRLESDGGSLDPKKAFLPFGPQPTIGSRFMVGSSEALSKKLSELSITVMWKGAPKEFNSHYKDYKNNKNQEVNNNYFTANVYFKDGGDWENSRSEVTLFHSDDASFPYSIPITSSNKSPVSPDMMQDGFITFSLKTDFLHAAYRTEYVTNMVTYSKEDGNLTVLNEPYTPAIQSISLTYTATDEVNIASTSLEDFSNSNGQFFHIAYSGQMREDSYRRRQFEFLNDKRVSLLPAYPYEGELLIGFSNLKAGDSVSVLFQVAEGSDNSVDGLENIDLFVLCDN